MQQSLMPSRNSRRTKISTSVLASTAIIVLAISGPLCQAQDPSVTDNVTIQQLMQEVRELQEKVRKLESQQDTVKSDSPSSPLQPSPASPRPSTDDRQTLSLEQELHKLEGIQWKGFGELNYKVLDQKHPGLGTFGFVPGSAGNFYTGDFDLLLTSRITDKASVLAEVVIGEGDAQRFGVDLERTLFKYDVNDHFANVVWPLSHWNRVLQFSLS